LGQQRGNRAVNAAAHADQGFLLFHYRTSIASFLQFTTNGRTLQMVFASIRILENLPKNERNGNFWQNKMVTNL
jgi:hypothetical protein